VVILILLVHAFASCFMAGLCWCVQLVHYPMFALIAPGAALGEAARVHARRITWIVAPVMLAEAVSASLLFLAAIVRHHPSDPATALKESWIVFVGAGMLVMNWLSTFLVVVPLHHRLQTTGDTSLVPRLVRVNLPRTLLWTARGILALVLVAVAGSRQA